MPYFPFSESIAAGATVNALRDWNMRYPPVPCMIEIMLGTSAAGLVYSLTTGPESIVQSDRPVGIGLAAGTLPARQNFEPIVDEVPQGQEISLPVRNTSGGALTINGVAIMTFLKGGR